MPYQDSLGQPAGYEDEENYGPIGFAARENAPVADRTFILPRQPLAQEPSAAPSLAMDAVLNKFGGSMDAYNRWWSGLAGDKPRNWNQALQMLGEGPGATPSPGGGMGVLRVEDLAPAIRNPVVDVTPGPEDPSHKAIGLTNEYEQNYNRLANFEHAGMQNAFTQGAQQSPQMSAALGLSSPFPPFGQEQQLGAGTSPLFPPFGQEQQLGASAGVPYVAGQQFHPGMFPGASASQVSAAPSPGVDGIWPHGAPPLPTPEVDGMWPQTPPDVPYVAGQPFTQDMFPSGPGMPRFNALDALKQRAQERMTASQRFQEAAQKLSK